MDHAPSLRSLHSKDIEMLESYLQMGSLLLVAGLFGGMLLFSAGFAALLFKYLPATQARMLIRKAFPPFYLFVISFSGLAALLCWTTDSYLSTWMAFVALTAVAARQWLMPAINQATDMGHRLRFVWLHGFSVALTVSHVAVSGMVLIHRAS
jgi:hypothetical protein